MAYRLMAADYDLTLTGSDRKVSAHTRETIRAVYAAGKFVTLASGRLGGSAEVARELFPGDVPLILGNGGLVQSCTTGETLSETLMDEPTALTMLRWCRRRASAAIVYGRSGIYTDRVNAASEMYAQRSSSTPLPLPSPEEAAHEGIYKILLLGLPLTVRRAAKKLHSAPPQPVDCFASSPEALEIGRQQGRGSRARGGDPRHTARGDHRHRRRGKRHFHAPLGGARHRHGERARERESRGGRHRARL